MKFAEKIQQAVVLALVVFFMATCGKQNGIGTNDNTSSTSADVALVQSISASATKTVVKFSELPISITKILANDYSEYCVAKLKKVEGLGYEVHVKKHNGAFAEECDTLYFDESGQKLSEGAKEDDNACDDDRLSIICGEKECFDFVYPVSFVMPYVNEVGTTTLTITSEADWIQIQAWYKANPTVNKKPTPVYPVKIYFDKNPDEQIEIKNEVEMLEAVFSYKSGDYCNYKKRKSERKEEGSC